MNIKEFLSKWFTRLRGLIISIVAILFLGFCGYLTIIFGGGFIVDEKALILPSTSTLVTEDGEEIARLYHENRKPVSIDQIPEHVENAFLAIEDQRFRNHAGVDFTSVMRAIYRDILAMDKVEGASTITQQLAKNLFLESEKTWMRKTKEVMAAIYLERHYSKDKILEFYLNEIYFAHGNYGVEAASNYYFNKSVSELTLTEGALLAGLVKAPNSYTPINEPEKAKQRRNLVLHQMNQMGIISTENMLQSQGKTLGLNLSRREERPWIDAYVDAVVDEAEAKYQLTESEIRRGGYQIVVPMDKQAQQIAYEKMQQQDYYYGSTGEVEGAFVLMDEHTGQLKAIIGGSDYQAGDLNRAFVNRQPGSTIKPLAVYSPAMMLEENYEPYSFLPDEIMSYDGYTAENVDDQYSGSVTVYDAIRQSKNAPAVWLLNEIGVSYAKTYLEKMNIDISDSGLAIALGGLETGITPVQLAEGYRTFIHHGEWTEAYTITRIYNRNGEIIAAASPNKEEVFSPQVAWNTLRMLESVVDYGTGQIGEYNGALAGKTGTTQHPRVSGGIKDAWFVGVTPNYVTALWMGYDYSDEQHYLTKGSSAATVLTKDILSELNKHEQMTAEFEVPATVVDLPEPIRLSNISDLTAQFKFGGATLIRGELNWTPAEDRRIVYHVYKKSDTEDEKIGEVTGRGAFTVKRVNVFQETTYYVVPYDPVTKQEGTKSNEAVLEF